jgi:hypothetical protein
MQMLYTENQENGAKHTLFYEVVAVPVWQWKLKRNQIEIKQNSRSIE